MMQTKTPKVFSLGKECPMCGQKTYLRMTEEEENQWRKYVCFSGHIQDRFPDMDVQKREFIKSGYCPDCQKALFGTEYDRSDFIIVDDIEDGEVPKLDLKQKNRMWQMHYCLSCMDLLKTGGDMRLH